MTTHFKQMTDHLAPGHGKCNTEMHARAHTRTHTVWGGGSPVYWAATPSPSASPGRYSAKSVCVKRSEALISRRRS